MTEEEAAKYFAGQAYEILWSTKVKRARWRHLESKFDQRVSEQAEYSSGSGNFS
jgi:hypothetical protein